VGGDRQRRADPRARRPAVRERLGIVLRHPLRAAVVGDRPRPRGAPPKTEVTDAAFGYGFNDPGAERPGDGAPAELAEALSVDLRLNLAERQRTDMQWWRELSAVLAAWQEGRRMGAESARQMAAATAHLRTRQ
jgi:hypothetical protein